MFGKVAFAGVFPVALCFTDYPHGFRLMQVLALWAVFGDNDARMSLFDGHQKDSCVSQPLAGSKPKNISP
ncbi:hypothetical protein DKO99_03915 [Salmonella enterica subsp. enterica serovar Derby]|nr:hypothetical protein [Salmonella enterica subsp. enterica serovar Derby]ECM6877085.1 CRISPR-associated DxTHG motif protein [Salmonella enterica subsp. enterica serovar Derby]